MKTVLVTGGAGFIGSHLCEALLNQDIQVVSIDSFNDFYDPALKYNNIRSIENYLEQRNTAKTSFTSIEGDIRDKNQLHSIFEQFSIDTVFHIAAYAGVRPSIDNPQLYYDVNVTGTLNVLECMKEFDVKKLIFASSSSVYGNSEKVPFSESDTVDLPISPYAATKKTGELLVHVYHHLYCIDVMCLRFFTVYGPRQRPDLAIRKFTELIADEIAIPFFGDGTTERDYTYIDDIIDGVLKAYQFLNVNHNRYEIINLGESQTVSLKRMVDSIEKRLSKKAVIQKLPMQAGDVHRTFADISKAKALINFDPKVDFEKGMDLFFEWFKSK
jgi:UDP-glucuronate 4-epimerase